MRSAQLLMCLAAFQLGCGQSGRPQSSKKQWPVVCSTTLLGPLTPKLRCPLVRVVDEYPSRTKRLELTLDQETVSMAASVEWLGSEEPPVGRLDDDSTFINGLVKARGSMRLFRGQNPQSARAFEFRVNDVPWGDLGSGAALDLAFAADGVNLHGTIDFELIEVDPSTRAAKIPSTAAHLTFAIP